MIPKIVHFCWLSRDPDSPKIKKCLVSWKKYLPDYEFILWDIKRFNLNDSTWVKQSFEKKKYAFAADNIRFYALYNYGGINLDSDVEVLKSFNDLLDLPYFVRTEQAGTIEAAVIGAEKGCDWIKSCLMYYDNRKFILPDGNFDIKKLPEIMNIVIKKNKQIINLTETEIQELKNKDLTKSVYVFPNYYFSPKLFDSRKTIIHPETYTIHHYQNSWFSTKAFYYYRFRTILIRIIGYSLVRKIEKLFFKR
ncbi:MAG: glycosyltransferase [Massilibacteroides sp.]|nr:glycosyltransferase [Massilibacteroides sp.]